MAAPIGISDAANEALRSIERARSARTARRIPAGIAETNEDMLVAQAQRSARQAARYVEISRQRSLPSLDAAQWTFVDAEQALQRVEEVLRDDPDAAIQTQAERLPRRSLAALLR